MTLNCITQPTESNMSMRITDLDKSRMLKAAGLMKHEARAERFGRGNAISDRKEQRRLDRAAGLVPFASKLPAELVKALTDEATAKKLDMNELVEALITKGLASPVVEESTISDG